MEPNTDHLAVPPLDLLPPEVWGLIFSMVDDRERCDVPPPEMPKPFIHLEWQQDLARTQPLVLSP